MLSQGTLALAALLPHGWLLGHSLSDSNQRAAQGHHFYTASNRSHYCDTSGNPLVSPSSEVCHVCSPWELAAIPPLNLMGCLVWWGHGSWRPVDSCPHQSHSQRKSPLVCLCLRPMLVWKPKPQHHLEQFRVEKPAQCYLKLQCRVSHFREQ